MIANPKEMLVLGLALLAALLLSGGVIYGLMRITSTQLLTFEAKPTAVPTKPVATEKRVFPQAEMLSRLRQEMGRRRVAFNNPDVQLVPPDSIVVRGRIQGPTGVVPVEAELQMSVTADGTPRLASKRLSAVGVAVPPEAIEALKRIEEANWTLPEQIPTGQALKRLYVENNAVVTEPDGPRLRQRHQPSPNVRGAALGALQCGHPHQEPALASAPRRPRSGWRCPQRAEDARAGAGKPCAGHRRPSR